MKMLKLLIALISVSSIVYAQGGSNYSMYGIGDIHNNLGAKYEGMGGTSIAIPSESAINLKNPALWSYVTTTRLQAGYHYNQRHIVSGDNSLDQSNASVNQILGIFSIDTAKGIAVSFGIMPYSSVNYYIKKQEIIKNDEFDFTAISYYQGTGGVSTAYLGGATEIFDNLRVGLAANVFFGTMKRTVNTLSSDADVTVQEQAFSNFDVISGSALRGGLFYEPTENLYFGAFIEKILNFSTENKLTTDGSWNIVDNDTTITNNYDLKLPDSYGFGVGYKINKFLIGAELSMQDFSNFKMEKTDKVKFKNSMTMSLGLSRIGNSSFRASFLDKITYNCGLGYKQLYYNVNGKDINEYYGSIGFDIPLVGASMINTAFTFGVRGENTTGLLKETFGRMNINISLGETWFQPFKQDY